MSSACYVPDIQRAYERSRLFDDGVPDYAQMETAAVIDYPFTMGGWGWTDNNAISQTLIFCGSKDAAEEYCALFFRDTGVVLALAHKYGAAALGLAVSTTSYSANRWHHLCGTFKSASLRAAYLDGGGKGSDATVVGAMVNHNRTAIGMARDSTVSNGLSGRTFWPCIWKGVILTDAEIAAIGNRSNPTPPWEIRPESIVSMPNMGNLYDPFMKALWTPTGTVPANPPWLWRPRQVSMYIPGAVSSIAKHVIQAHRRAG